MRLLSQGKSGTYLLGISFSLHSDGLEEERHRGRPDLATDHTVNSCEDFPPEGKNLMLLCWPDATPVLYLSKGDSPAK